MRKFQQKLILEVLESMKEAQEAGYFDVIFGGRLADYRYYDMWQVIRNALDMPKGEFDNNLEK